MINWRLDRLSHVRGDANALQRLVTASTTRFVPLSNLRVLLTRDTEPGALLLTRDELPEPSPAALIFLGTVDEQAYFAVEVGEEIAGAAGEWSDLRAAAVRMRSDDVSLLAYARAMSHWHATHLFCGRCGSPTRIASAGHERFCTNVVCGAKHFPRTDPAVIALVTFGDKALVGRQSTWPEGMFSVLAGFVEPAETLEQAVAREVLEEAGVRLHGISYFGSQPWPFPSSLMVGFTALADSEELEIDTNELSEARWLTRDEASELLTAKQIRFPPHFSIARQLIESWRRGDHPR